MGSWFISFIDRSELWTASASVPGSMRLLAGLLVVASCSAAEVNYASCASAKESPPGPGGRKLTLLAGQILHSSDGADGSKDAKPISVPLECGTLSGIPQEAAGGGTLTDVSIAFIRLKSRRQPSLGQLVLLQVRVESLGHLRVPQLWLLHNGRTSISAHFPSLTTPSRCHCHLAPILSPPHRFPISLSHRSRAPLAHIIPCSISPHRSHSSLAHHLRRRRSIASPPPPLGAVFIYTFTIL